MAIGELAVGDEPRRRSRAAELFDAADEVAVRAAGVRGALRRYLASASVN